MDQLTVNQGVKAPTKISAPGATWDPDRNGVHFNLFSANAGRVELCLFDKGGRERKIDLKKDQDGMWYGFVPDIKPGQAYGYRVHGPYDPANGKRFNPNKLLLDPYAKEMTGKLVWDEALFGYNWGGSPNDPKNFNTKDSAPFMPKAVVTGASLFDWKNTKRPETPWPRSVVYEAHVKGFSKLNPDVPEDLRGTYAGMGAEASVRHFKNIGVTAVELLPTHEFKSGLDLDEQTKKGLTNYWGYDTLNFFTPHRAYGSSDQFKEMVRNLHEADLELIQDVVFNHTCEGNENGPTLSFKGIDNESYYALMPGNKGLYINDTGTGNLLNANHPKVVELIAASMRHWIDEYHVDGFRFDLGVALGRDPAWNYAYNRDAPLYKAIKNVMKGRDASTGKPIPDAPVIKVKAEPWDCGPGGYQHGNLPSGFREWSDKYKDVRGYWLRGGPSSFLAAGLSALAESFNNDGKDVGRKHGFVSRKQRDGLEPVRDVFAKAGSRLRPRISQVVNKLRSHDGFTLWDTVSYSRRHNEANGEGNQDGNRNDTDLSHNFGHEGPTNDPSIASQRLKHVFSMLGTLFMSSGTIMLAMGDEFGQTQKGNNNPYCQDNEISYLDWKKAKSETGQRMIGFVRTMADLRQSVSLFGSHMFAHGLRTDKTGHKDLTWFSPAGHERTGPEWNETGCFAQMLNNKAFPARPQAKLSPVDEDSRILNIFNNQANWVPFKLPDLADGGVWKCLVNTSLPTPNAGQHELSRHAPGTEYIMPPGTMACFVQAPVKPAA